MATAKKAAAKKVAVVAVSPAAQAALRNAFAVQAHARAAELKLAVGDRVQVINFAQVQRGNNGAVSIIDRNAQPLPAGHNVTEASRSTVNSVYGNELEFRGINANGDFMLRYGNRDIGVPYTFVGQPRAGEQKRGSLKLNDSYSADVLNDGTTVAVGCQRFEASKLRALLAMADKVAAEQKGKSKTRAVHVVTAKPSATYVAPAPKAAKKAVAKKAIVTVK